MTAPSKPWERTLNNNSQMIRNTTVPGLGNRSAPILPPRPQALAQSSSYGSYGSSYSSPYSSYGSSLGYGGYGSSYGGMGYRSSMYGGYGSMGGYGSYGGFGSSYGMGSGMYGYGPGYGGVNDDAERRFIQFAEESSRNTFANFESIVRAFSSMAMMLDNTFFAMTSSFRAILGVADNFGRLRSVFAQVWHALNIFRLFRWMYRRAMQMAGFKIPPGNKSLAWQEALSVSDAAAAAAPSTGGGSSWSTLAFFGMIMSLPYVISKFLPKYEDKLNPENWKSAGISAKAVFEFPATAPNELSLHLNDEVTLAPKHIQEEMKLTNSGWAYATCNGRSGVVPLNYIVVTKRTQNVEQPLIPRKPVKRVSFGENQIFEAKEPDQEDWEVKTIKMNIKQDSPEINEAPKIEENTSITLQNSELPEITCTQETAVVNGEEPVRESNRQTLSQSELLQPQDTAAVNGEEPVSESNGQTLSQSELVTCTKEANVTT